MICFSEDLEKKQFKKNQLLKISINHHKAINNHKKIRQQQEQVWDKPSLLIQTKLQQLQLIIKHQKQLFKIKQTLKLITTINQQILVKISTQTSQLPVIQRFKLYRLKLLLQPTIKISHLF